MPKSFPFLSNSLLPHIYMFSTFLQESIPRILTKFLFYFAKPNEDFSIRTLTYDKKIITTLLNFYLIFLITTKKPPQDF